ncbi:MAG: hypothetical protein DMD35_03595 [Gemmatimonadetes bacterium]|nr:MAG: hypothetical protein DMD35_03595 [Gemmatimonadota bacterium]
MIPLPAAVCRTRTVAILRCAIVPLSPRTCARRGVDLRHRRGHPRGRASRPGVDRLAPSRHGQRVDHRRECAAPPLLATHGRGVCLEHPRPRRCTRRHGRRRRWTSDLRVQQGPPHGVLGAQLIHPEAAAIPLLEHGAQRPGAPRRGNPRRTAPRWRAVRARRPGGWHRDCTVLRHDRPDGFGERRGLHGAHLVPVEGRHHAHLRRGRRDARRAYPLRRTLRELLRPSRPRRPAGSARRAAPGMTSLPTADPLARARRLARLLDSAARVPGTQIRFGADAVLGLVPGLGDVAGAALAGYLVLLARRHGAPRSVVLRMLANVAVDTIGGTVPLAGDLFDVAYKSNLRNLALLEGAIERPAATTRTSRLVVVGTLLGIVLLVAGGLVVTVLAIRAIAAAVNSG